MGLGTAPTKADDPSTVGAMAPERGLHRHPLDSDVVELLTVGIDVGSATFHLSVSRVVLERRAQALSTRYDVVARETVFTSPVAFTPYLPSGDIDAASVDAAVRRSYSEGGIDPEEIDSGVVLLTGSALLRRNARALAERLAGAAGRFVCATAGHHYEAVLAAHGSGAVARSKQTGGPVVALDVGGATTKLALVRDGEVRATAAVGVGSRLLAWDRARRLVRVEETIVPVAHSAGVAVEPGDEITLAQIDAICDQLALAVVVQLSPVTPADGAAALASCLTDPFVPPDEPFEIVASGGVAEYLVSNEAAGNGRGVDDRGDLGPHLARALLARLQSVGLASCMRVGEQRIRATVIGASQFSTQVSGSTVAVDPEALPLHHVPVVRPVLDLGLPVLEPEVVAAALEVAVRQRFSELEVPETLAVSLQWRGDPTYTRLRAIAGGLVEGQHALGLTRIVVTLDADIASSLGRIITTELGASRGAALCLDSLDLAELDYVDVGRLVEPANVVPVVVKSLLYSTAGSAPSPASIARSELEPAPSDDQGEPG